MKLYSQPDPPCKYFIILENKYLAAGFLIRGSGPVLNTIVIIRKCHVYQCSITHNMYRHISMRFARTLRNNI